MKRGLLCDGMDMAVPGAGVAFLLLWCVFCFSQEGIVIAGLEFGRGWVGGREVFSIQKQKKSIFLGLVASHLPFQVSADWVQPHFH